MPVNRLNQRFYPLGQPIMGAPVNDPGSELLPFTAIHRLTPQFCAIIVIWCRHELEARRLCAEHGLHYEGRPEEKGLL